MAKRIDGLCFLSEDPDNRARAVARVKAFVDFASDWGAGVVVGSLRGVIADKSRRSTDDQRFFESMERILEHAEARKATVLLELINRYENNYLNTVQEALAYLKPLTSPYLKLNLDTFHMNIEESDMAGAMLLCAERMGHLHLADNTRMFPGSGALDFHRILSTAESIGYQGYASLECLPLPDPDIAARSAMDFISALRPDFCRNA
jgi:sugar phosphate isomerase/epimerase